MKHRFIKMTLLSLAMSLSLIGNAQQIFGKWVIPTESYGTRFTNELTFTENGIEINDQLTPPAYSPVEFSAGGYSPNYDLSFYVLGETFWDGSTPFDWVTTQSPYLQPEFQIINMPGEPNKYYSFFTGDNISDRSTDFHFCYNEIEMVDGTAQLSDKILLRGGLENYISFAITKPDNGEQKLFVCSGRNSNPVYPDYLAGIRMWTITNNSITGGELVISEEDQLLDQWDFDAYNMEYTFYLENNEKKDVMAWIHGIDNPSYQQDVTELIVVNDGIAQKFFLNSGRLAGIEFSTFETGVIYVSSAIGLLKVNYNTGQVVEVLSNNNYQATYLQTAPDGHIYGVSNSGDNLCQINMTTGVFSANYYPFPINHQVSSQKLLTGTTPYYILPENERVFIPLQETVVVEPESCPDMYDGEVWITVTGGAPFQSPNEPYLITCQPEVTFTWDEENHWFHGTGLTEGIYEYTITDAAENEINDTFIIEEDDSYYDFKDTKFEVSASRSLPDAAMPLNTYSFEAGILIRSGATLTITGSVYEFGKWANVIVEPGATLELVGTTLTNHEECHLIWQGVEVQGDATMPQQPELINGVWVYHQGRLVMQNATISNAYQAVGLLTRNSNGDIEVNSGGGIVVANNSAFINNVNSVQFIPYKNFNPGSLAQIDNVSYFSDCNFVIDQSYLGDETFSNHVNMYGVKGIDFRGCDFSNTALHDISTTNTGIVAYGAGFTVTSLCSQHIDPCPASYVVPCTFSGFYNAISVYGDNSYIYSYLVENSLFSNNKIGILNSKVNYPVIINNEFFIGHDHPELTYGGYVGLGVDCQQSTGFAIENNEFHKNGAAPLGSYIGVRIKETETGFDEVYKNTFDGLAGGNLSEGQNWKDGDRWKGLAYYCNENNNNWADFYVSSDRPSGIQARQGDDDHAAGNTFSPSATWHFFNGGADEIGYYYNQNVPDQVPDDKKLYHVTDEARNNVNTCQEHYTGGGSVLLTSVQKTDKETDFLNNLYDYNSVEAQYEALVDGGSTSGELSDIQTATPDKMWELRTKLLGDSPHLSLEVLMEASDRTDVFPDDVLFDILAANPDELKRDTLISYLETKENPLPDYMIAILLQVAQGTSYKTVLQNQMSLYNQYKTKAANDIVRSILNDSLTDLTELRNWLDNTSTLKADEQIIATYMHEGNYSDALAMAALLPDTYNLSGEELTEHTNYVTLLNLQIAMAQSNRNVFQLDSTEFNTLQSLANNSKGTGGVLARNLLEYGYGYHFYTFPELNDTASYKIQPVGWNNFIVWSGIEISAKPNPARAWTAFDYVLPDADSKGSILIIDVSGRLIQTIPVSGLQGQEVWDTREVKGGVYFFTLNAGGISKTGKIVVSK